MSLRTRVLTVLLCWMTAAPSIAADTVEYVHTDALGSPVAITDANRVVIERSEYEPYGALLNRPLTDGPGYTGHVTDAGTGLTYMQQRYYDSEIGRFLSVDPVLADMNTGQNFNRYWYADDNPYRFTDPDGRRSKEEAEHRREMAAARTSLTTRSPIAAAQMTTSARSRPREPSAAGQVMLRLLAGGVATNANMRSTHPDRIDQSDANQAFVQTRAITLGGGVGVALAPVAGPASAEALSATGIAANAKTAREILYAGCIVLGCAQGGSPTSTRIRQAERIEQARAGNLREGRRQNYELPDPKP